jgi:capsular exopolysaccharide synthesis family protein
MQGFKNNISSNNDDIILSDYVRLVFRNIHWIVLFGSIAFCLAYLQLRYEDEYYEAKGSIKIDTENNNLLKDVAILKDFGSPKDKILTETYIIKSKLLILKAVEQLPIGVSYFSSGRVVNKEIYTSSPIIVTPVNPDSVWFDKSYSLSIESDNDFTIMWEDELGRAKSVKARFGDTIEFDKNKVCVSFDHYNFLVFKQNTRTFNFVFNSKNSLYERVSSNLFVEQVDKGVSVINIVYQDVVPEFARDLVNQLSKVYTEYDIMYKSQTATQTIEFMNRLINDLNKTVQTSELNMADFKQGNNLLDIELANEKGLSDLTDMQVNQRMLQLQLLAIENVEKQISENKNTTSLPINVDSKVDPVLIELLSDLNKLNAEKIVRSEKLTPSSSGMIELNKQISEVIQSVKQNIRFTRQKINTQIDYYQKQINTIIAGMHKLPTVEKQYITLKRDLEVNQKVYGFLLQTKLEASISRASIVSSARIIDEAETPRISVHPNRKLTFLVYVTLGLTGGIVLIIALRVLNNKIHSIEEIEAICNLPVLGTVLAYPQKLADEESRLLAVKEHRTVFGESLRAVRTNLQFLLPNKKSKIITISSTISGEGKTFTTINLAGSLTMLDKRVVLIGCDLRKPQLANTFRVNTQHGLSSYLIGKSTIEEIIGRTDIENLSVILTGSIPPNPSELLNTEKMSTLLASLQEMYDYILLDTPPVGLVSDAIVLMKQSDIVLYVVKAGYSQKEFLQLPSKIKNEHNLKSVYLLLNSYKADKKRKSGSYGYYGYGGRGEGYYYEYDNKSKMQKTWKNRFNW